MAADGLLKISELAAQSGVSAGTIKHYLREGLLGGGDQIVKTSRNMAYYPPDFVDRIRLIKRLQEERFMPLRHIKNVLDLDETERLSRAQASERHGVPRNVLARLEELGVPSGLRAWMCTWTPPSSTIRRASAAYSSGV